MSDRSFAVLILLVAITEAAILVGCAGATQSGLAPAATSDGRSTANAAGGGTAVSQQTTNDPIAGWIMSAGYAVIVPLCFLVYMLSKRWKLHGWITGARKPASSSATLKVVGRAAEIAQAALKGAPPPFSG